MDEEITYWEKYLAVSIALDDVDKQDTALSNLRLLYHASYEEGLSYIMRFMGGSGRERKLSETWRVYQAWRDAAGII